MMQIGCAEVAGAVLAEAPTSSVNVEIGGIPIALRCSDAEFRTLIERRYAGFVNPDGKAEFQFDFELTDPAESSDEDAEVFRDGTTWHLQRGDFQAAWDIKSRRGWVRQAINPYSLDSVLRITHSLVLAEEGGFLLHAASAIRNGRAFVFSGVSGAGKTTTARLAPADVKLLTDEVSYVRRSGGRYFAYGTPFSGELARAGENLFEAIDTLYFLVKGPTNRIDPISPTEAARALLRNILFFAHDAELVQRVFDAAVQFVSTVKVAKLVFTPDTRAWDLVR